MKRFLNADSYGSTGQGFTGFNMFAYCNNSPSNRTDPDGNSSLVIRPQVCITDPGDDTCGCGGFGGGGEIIPLGLLKLIVDIFTPSVNSVPEVYNPNANAKAIPQSEAKSIAIPTEKVEEKEDKHPQTLIYRYYSTKTSNLAPRPGIDVDGLSFSLIPPTRPKQYPIVVTTLEAIEATGILTAILHGTHVSIVPTNGTIAEWMAQGQNSCWSSILSEIVIQIGE